MYQEITYSRHLGKECPFKNVKCFHCGNTGTLNHIAEVRWQKIGPNEKRQIVCHQKEKFIHRKENISERESKPLSQNAIRHRE